MVCLMIDIDHFKRFNDEFGHDAGDVVMQYVAQIVIDTVGEAGSAYRFGGEEFTVLLPGMTEAAGFEFAEQLRTRIATAPLSHRGRILGSVAVSIGVASAPAGGTVPTLLTRADGALLNAKASRAQHNGIGRTVDPGRCGGGRIGRSPGCPGPFLHRCLA